MKYVLPVQGGKKEFCSEPCLTSYRKASKAGPGASGSNAGSIKTEPSKGSSASAG